MLRAGRAAWPLVALAAGLPIWWILGLAELVFFFLAVPMVLRLMTVRPLRVPSWFGLWLAFLAVVLFSAPLMSVHAPSTLDASLGTGLLTFSFRAALYVVATVFLLYVVNLSERELPTAVVGEVLAGIFLITVAGGVLGVLAPDFELTSPVERLLPAGTNDYLLSLVHPAAADVQTVLGYPQARPKAPYLYANSWGANFTVTLPFFIWRYARRGAALWRRLTVVPVLAAGAVGVTYSLNRGLWIGIGLAVAVFALHQIRQRGALIMPGLVVVTVAVAVGVAVSPLSEVITQRLDSPHSNQRRGDLASVTIASVAEGSPVLGFGNTRRLSGSFYSIAGAATEDCPACAVPPLGTQGHFWLVLFTQGFLGTALFFGFLLVGVWRNLRRRDPVAVACVAALVPLLFETLVYDTLGLPFILAFLILGLMARSAPEPQVHRLDRLTVALRAGWARVVVCTVAGLGVGFALLPAQETYQATVDVLIPSNPVYLSTSGSRVARGVTIDTEARTAVAEPVLAEVRRDANAPGTEFTVSAVPGSRVLVLTATGPDAGAVRRAANRLAGSVVEAQQERLRTLRSTLVQGTEDRIDAIDRFRASASAGSRGVYSGLLYARRVDRDRVARELLVDARQIRSARVEVSDRKNALVPPLSGLVLGALLGCLLAAVRSREPESNALQGPGTERPRPRHRGPARRPRRTRS